MLKTALELAERDVNVALVSPRVTGVVTVIAADRLGTWLEIGSELTQVDSSFALEYIRRVPRLPAVLPIEDARAWATFGLKLISQNGSAKRTISGPSNSSVLVLSLLGDIDDQSVRAKVVTVGSLLAERDAGSGIAWLSESPRLLRDVPGMRDGG